jgi:Family of unknown function (DUF5681)
MQEWTMAKKKKPQIRNKKQVTSQKQPRSPEAYDVGYGRPPKHTRYRKGQTGNPTGINRKSAAVTSADLQELLDRALNKKVRQGDRTRHMTRAAAGIEHLVAQFAAGDRHARRDVFALAKEAGIDLMRGQNKKVVMAALAAEDEQIILDHLRRHGLEPKEPPATDADVISGTPTKHGDKGELK